MGVKYYRAIVDRRPSETNFSIVFPDFPSVTSATGNFADVMPQATDALAMAVEDMESDGEILPPSLGHSVLAAYGATNVPRNLLVPVNITGSALE